jgi:hypothetical protein
MNIDNPGETLGLIIMEIVFFIGFFKFIVRVGPILNIAYPRRYERYKSRKAKRLFKRAKLSAEEEQEVTKRIGLTRVEHVPRRAVIGQSERPEIT